MVNAGPGAGTLFGVRCFKIRWACRINLLRGGLPQSYKPNIHGPADPLHSAGVLIPFAGVPAATSGSFSGSALLTPQQLLDMISGLTYANIHTTVNPGGEIRGQVHPGN